MKTLLLSTVLGMSLLGTAKVCAQVQGNATRFKQVQQQSERKQELSERAYTDYLDDVTISNNGGSLVPANILPPAPIVINNGLELTVRVLSNQTADRYVAIFNLTQIAETADKTNQLMKERVEGFQSALKGMGIVDNNIYIDVVTFIPLYEYEKDKKIFSNRNNEVPKGYELQQNIHIGYTNADQLRAIMTTAAKFEVFDLITVEYQVDNYETVYGEMRQRAMGNIAQQLEGYEKQLGIDLTKANRSLAENKRVAYPSSRYSSYKAFANVSMGNINERSKTQDMYKPTTYYYDQLRAENFDIVIQPQVLEPAVQFVYELRLRIQMQPQGSEKPKNNYFWLTPTGQQVRVDPSATE